MQTEEEDMKTIRNQGHITLLQRNKEKKECLIIKKKKKNCWITFSSGKTGIIYKLIHFSAIQVSLCLPCEISQDTPDKSHNAKSKKHRLWESSIKRFWKWQLFVLIRTQCVNVHLSFIETETPGKLKPTWDMYK